MNDLTPSPCMTQEATGGSPTTQANIKSAAGPHSDALRLMDCPHCEGRGEIRGYATNNPSEKLRSVECEDCGGSGEIPEPCGPNCPCWIPGEGDTGSCERDDPAEEYTFNRGGFSLWREGEL